MGDANENRRETTQKLYTRPTMNDQKNEQGAIGVGVVGFGMASRVFHLPTIAAVSELRLSAIVQRRGDESRASYPQAKIVRSIDELLAEPDIKLVVVATPNETHFAFARQSLLANKHVVVDKPFTIHAHEAEELAALARKRGRILSVFQNRRYDGDFLTVRDLVSKKALGRLVSFEAYYDRFRPAVRNRWREQPGEGTGILYDLGPHLIDQALELFGTPESVDARILRERDGAATDDAFELHLGYPALRVHLGATMLAAAQRPRFYLRGTTGAFVKYGVDPQEAALVAGDHYASPNWGCEKEEAWGTVFSMETGDKSIHQTIATQHGDYRNYYRDIGTAILSNTQPSATAEHGVRVMRVIELALASHRENRALSWQ